MPPLRSTPAPPDRPAQIIPLVAAGGLGALAIHTALRGAGLGDALPAGVGAMLIGVLARWGPPPWGSAMIAALLAAIIVWHQSILGASIWSLSALPILVAVRMAAPPSARITALIAGGARTARAFTDGGRPDGMAPGGLVAVGGLALVVHQQDATHRTEARRRATRIEAEVAARTIGLHAQGARAERLRAAHWDTAVHLAREVMQTAAQAAQIGRQLVMAAQRGETDTVGAIGRQLQHTIWRQHLRAQDVLDIDRLAQHQPLVMTCEPIALDQIARRVAQRMAVPAQRATIALVVEIQPHGPAAWGDPHRVERVVETVMTNAYQAVLRRGTGGTITLSVRGDARLITWTVRDTGIGIDHARLQDLRHRLVRSMLPGAEAEGVGLGIPLCAQIVAHMGGALQIDSCGVNLGTTVSFTLPRAPFQHMVRAGADEHAAPGCHATGTAPGPQP